MEKPEITDLETAIHDTVGVMESAVVALNGVSGRIDAAVAAALLNGATEEQLQPILDEATSLRDHATTLAAAVAANS